MNLILIGAQGSGKGTQASLLVEELGIVHLSSGDVFRNAVKLGTPVGLEAKEYMDRGAFVPDRITIRLILDMLAQPEYTPGVVLDGFPRTRDQARALDEALPELHRAIDRAIYLNVPRETLFERLSGRFVCRDHQHVFNVKTKPPLVPGLCDIDGSPLIQRSDDTPAVIEKRLHDFFEQTIPVVHYYRAQGKLLEIDGHQPIERVGALLIEGLGITIEESR
ncbi:MAG: adenylate kinase [Ktedonobacterales bacterium]|nr:adenylate kinase [Ktedonobacterales bacterium]